MKIGEWYVSRTRHGPMVHARLGAAQENSGKLVSLLRKEAEALAERQARPLLICDGPPGIGCPVIASLSGVDAVLMVAEPSTAGIHDFERLVKLADHFGVVPLACINKFDINEEMADSVEELAARRGVETVGRIPYDQAVVQAQLRQTSIVEYSRTGAGAAIRDIWARVKARLDFSVVPRQGDAFIR